MKIKEKTTKLDPIGQEIDSLVLFYSKKLTHNLLKVYNVKSFGIIEVFFSGKSKKIPFPSNFNFLEVDKINLSQNNLKDLKNFNIFSNLVELNLSNNSIKPQNISELPISIKRLNLSKNQIMTINYVKNNSQASIFKEFLNLEEIDLSFNNLDKIPEKTFGENTKLQVFQKLKI